MKGMANLKDYIVRNVAFAYRIIAEWLGGVLPRRGRSGAQSDLILVIMTPWVVPVPVVKI